MALKNCVLIDDLAWLARSVSRMLPRPYKRCLSIISTRRRCTWMIPACANDDSALETVSNESPRKAPISLLDMGKLNTPAHIPL